MTDRELLEKAAQAAGLRYIKPTEDYSGIFGLTLCDEVGRHMEDWRPLTDDGDALRLAVRLGLHISQQLSYATVCHPHGPAATRGLSWATPYDAADPCTATRRAIVRAAAAIADAPGAA